MYDLDKKIIFTHPHKCGGTSIESILGFLSLREKNPGIHAFKHGSLEMHIDKIKLKGLDPSTFFKFSIIRNPWSRAVSFYNHNKYKEFYYYANEATDREIPTHVRDARCMTFKEFVLKYYKHDFNSKVSTKPYMFLGDKFSLDYIIRLENLKEDLLRIKDLLQIGLDVDIPCLNNTDEYAIRKNYQSYYDLETKNIIEKLFEWDINTFGYKFN
jgi:hypothetical protein